MKKPVFLQIHQSDNAGVRDELLLGLQSPQAHTSPKYLYDALGSRLFEAITELPEYYPTRTEADIFATHGDAMARHVPPGATLVDLGAGNCAKAASLFGRFAPGRYVAVDISVEFLRNALECLQRQYPALDMVGVGVDFSTGLELPPEVQSHTGGPQIDTRVLFYPGSSIGNFAPQDALAFLRSLHAACGTQPGSGLLIGVDLVKATTTLEAAYDDALGVTAAFNRNLLLHINRLCATDFHLPDWSHVALFNTAQSRIEMHLQATRAVTVRWPGGARAFALGERIHTENSYKWTLDSFAALLVQAGFDQPVHWTDAQQRFAVFYSTRK
jgi:L-histidine N-alpha-methyltransferase